MRIPVAVLGPTGYTGLELLEILSRHPGMEAAYLGSARSPGPRIDEEFPRLIGRTAEDVVRCMPIDHDAIGRAARLAFLCLPHEACLTHAPELLRRGVRVVDLSAAYRLADAGAYELAYGHRHTDAGNLRGAVYGLTEWTRDRVRGAALVANPGCYPTAAAIALLPLLRAGVIRESTIIIDAASGVSGAGREPKPHLHFVETAGNYSAYGIGTHRHQPEIEQTLRTLGARPAARTLFVPHLLPVERGILETIYAEPVDARTDTARLQEALNESYARERFVCVREHAPSLRDVVRTNRAHVNARVVAGRAVVVAAIDNLVKGAAGQAVQNANVMLGLDEHAGLE
ncbi:MAG: N-acetyl-gamma-glutamyl-phosphate reductase [Phycisphaerae bacterium]|nr:N-acetyl-gamma-glutamyl-phosphate reductase [Phycisphaerae bacterium]